MLDLIGKITAEGWLVREPVRFSAEHTGGYFSDCYLVEKNGSKAFLKALDIEKFDVSQLHNLLSGFQYESDLLAICKEKNLSRIVKVLESGKLERSPDVPPVLRYVPFLIFELAEGSIRDTVDISSKTVKDQWRFHILQQTATGLLQLHKQAIAHQDIKPSNVLRFSERELKLGDLGRASQRGKQAPHDGCIIAGARNYAPFEQLYGYLPEDWLARRLSTDVFHLGCLAVFVFTNICFPSFVLQNMAPPYHPKNWGESYVEVIPHIQAAMTQSLYDISDDLPERFRDELISIIKDLCHPDPLSRGRAGVKGQHLANALWLQRYISRFDILEKSARVRLPAKNV